MIRERSEPPAIKSYSRSYLMFREEVARIEDLAERINNLRGSL